MLRSAKVPNKPMLFTIRNAATRPYTPWVIGRACRARALPNRAGFSESRPLEASPTIPTPLAEPIQGRATARAAPRRARLVPEKMPFRTVATVSAGVSVSGVAPTVGISTVESVAVVSFSTSSAKAHRVQRDSRARTDRTRAAILLMVAVFMVRFLLFIGLCL